jgi:hypothetical protein
MSVCPSIRVEQLGSHWTDFCKIWVFFRKSVEKIQVWLKSLGEIFLEWEMLQTEVADKIKTEILYSINLFSKLVPFWGNVGGGEHELHCCFSTAPVVTLTHQCYAIRTLPILLLFLLWLSLCNTSDVRTIRHVFYCAYNKHFALVIKLYKHLIYLPFRRFKELSWGQQTSEEGLYRSVKPFHLLPTFSHSIFTLSSR